MKLNSYRAPQNKLYSGRSDSLATERFFQIIKLINLENNFITPKNQTAFALIGFACDAGIARNFGRMGAALGPEEFRKIWGNLALPVNKPAFEFYDLGDVLCVNNNIEEAQQDLSTITRYALDNNLIPIIIGGGHELSFGAYLGAAQRRDYNIGIINFDAHFDLRELKNNQANSGTSFSQIAQWCQQNNKKFEYLVLGLQAAANTRSLFARAQELNASYLEANFIFSHMHESEIFLDEFIRKQEKIYVTLCMDVFAESVAPGVSAPQSMGLVPDQVLRLLDKIIASQKVAAFDIAEYSPPLDQNNQTGRLCTAMAYAFLTKRLY